MLSSKFTILTESSTVFWNSISAFSSILKQFPFVSETVLLRHTVYSHLTLTYMIIASVSPLSSYEINSSRLEPQELLIICSSCWQFWLVSASQGLCVSHRYMKYQLCATKMSQNSAFQDQHFTDVILSLFIVLI